MLDVTGDNIVAGFKVLLGDFYDEDLSTAEDQRPITNELEERSEPTTNLSTAAQSYLVCKVCVHDLHSLWMTRFALASTSLEVTAQGDMGGMSESVQRRC